LLGILKSGGAYVPLDPNYPTERLQYMLEDAAPQVLLTQKGLRDALPATQAEVLELDEKLKEFAADRGENLPAAALGVGAGNLVYVIYTSGSTGRPKGTGMAHRSMVNLIEWHRNIFGDGAGQRVLQFAALSFDVAFQEIFSTLCTGGTLVLLSEWIRRDAQVLAQFLSQHLIERLFVPPLMLQSLAESCQASGVVPGSLRDVITAGEQLRISPEISGLFEKLNQCWLHNHYGPTETHVVTSLTLRGEPGQWPVLPTIGQPISNTQIYVLDGQRQPVPLGVAGEIYIGGVAVAQGYRGRAELTAQRFIQDPFRAEEGARLYRTGDLGRWRTDGTLEYLGRNDDQVKIRGYRIELGEIEAQLARHEQVKEAAVVVREDVAGEKRLVAYITLRTQADPGVEELRTYLKALLPEYMIPSAFVTLESLPLTPNGKLNRRGLPAPELAAYVSREYEPPQGEVEKVLAQIWQQLLRVARVGRLDNFFELGGHSLLATQVTVRIRSSLSIDMPIRMLFEHPTLHQLSAQVEELRQLQLLERVAEGGDEIQDLLERVVSMPASTVEELVRQLPMGGRS
jgi:amino acid adenylation domain-containing protein